jgi:penicillin amidase
VEPGEHYALASVAFAYPEQASVIGMLGMMQATDMDEFKLALDDWSMPAANIVAADDQGSVTYSMLGTIPVWDSAAPAGGYIAQDGGTWSSRWQDVIPQDYLPEVTDPSEGLVYSANHRPAGEWYPLPLVTPNKVLGHTHRS